MAVYFTWRFLAIFLICYSGNIIYLTTCNQCYLQYVGEITQKLNERLNWHKSGFSYPLKYRHCHVPSDYFDKGMCKEASFKIQMIE